MKYSRWFFWCAAFAGLGGVIILSPVDSSVSSRAFAQAPQASAPQRAQPDAGVILPDAPGRDVAKRVCSGCHSAEVWAKQRHTPEQWGVIVDRMVTRGAEGNDVEFAQIVRYLSTNLASPPPPAGTAPAAMPQAEP